MLAMVLYAKATVFFFFQINKYLGTDILTLYTYSSLKCLSMPAVFIFVVFD